ncbi:MAG: 2,3-bisphosphoglycerate-independent phosphoglycerate mutase [Alphaproteobacteria bacterium]|jgi:2,3-bisphosphoglycerate-independent phosphoglycerate mutase|nr:2,3-bisphosphoglycerate-independent phosphoglycerate mutase [Alphaproteobacteria bacterium]
MTKSTQKLILTILDGWGYTQEHPEFNAIEAGKTPNWHKLLTSNPSANLITFGEDVGLPEGQMGNSEVGHTNIGAGRVVYQELPRINKAIKDGEFDNNPKIQKAIAEAKATKAKVHIMGLYSSGGVHSHLNHLIHSSEVFAKSGVEVVLHLFTDGRDTPPQSAITYNQQLNDLLSKYPNIKVGTVSGRYYAMDRDKRWERIELAYNAMVLGTAEKTFNTFMEVLEDSYANSINDEFVKPAVIKGYEPMKDNDIVFMINFRTDRARQILDSLFIADFNGFNRKKVIKFGYSLGMVSYSDTLKEKLNTVFEAENLNNSLGEWLAKQKLTQLRVAETEKYPHVTFFFSGGRENPYEGEDRILVPSPKVATYDLQPEMSAYGITEQLTKCMKEKSPDFIVVNYANGDMVGHTGVMAAATKAAETVDKCLADLEKAVIENDYIWIIIADHGNCETMWDFTNNVPHTQHTTNLVKIVLCNQHGTNFTLADGKLADVAPTVLNLMKVELPAEMDGKSLLKK